MKLLYCILLFAGLAAGSCSVAPPATDPIPEHDTFTIQSRHVGEERVINVWKPSDYDTHTAALPVLYMPDGGIQEDFPHIANTLAELVASEKIPPFLLVGIENTQRRRDLTGETNVGTDREIAPVVGGSGDFIAFIKDELMPEIDRKYRTTGEKGLIGESLAGLFVVETFLLQPAMFDYYIAFDPSLWWNDQYLIKTAKEHLAQFPPEQAKKFWFAGSGAEDIGPIMNGLVTALEDANIANLEWTYSDEPGEKHSTILRATKEKAMIWALSRPEE